MASLIRTSLLMVFATSALFACSKKAPELTPTKSATPVVLPQAKALEAAQLADNQARLDPNDPKHGARKMMGLDVAVYVDGVQTSVIRFGDLPPMAFETTESGTRRYKLYDYVKAIGVAPESIKSIHIHANNDRIASVEGSELLKEKDRFVFQFLSQNTGAPITRWSSTGLKNEFGAHEFRKVSIYVKKPSAPIDLAKGCHVGADGECSDAVPYASGDVVKGTRIYVDGKMVGFVKRRQLSESIIMGDTAEGDKKYNVAKLVASMGVDMNGIKSVELVAGDDVIARADGAKFSQISSDFYFTLPKHNHGKVRVHVPTAIQSKESASVDKDALISSVQIFKSTKPTDRDLTAISEDTDLSVQLASNTAQELGRAGER